MKAAKAASPEPCWLFLGKRFYTNKDALQERFGRIYQLPFHWARDGGKVRLWLVDYHTRESREVRDESLQISSAPALSARSFVLFALMLLRARPEVIIASGDCYIGFLGWLLARLCGSVFVFDIYDKYDEFAGYVRPFGWDIFGFLRRRADVRSYAAASLAGYFDDLSCAKTSVIVPNGIDDQKFKPMDLASCRDQLGLEQDARLVGYFGSMLAERGVDDLVAAVGLVREHAPDIKLLLCGGPVSTGGYAPWVIYRGVVPHQAMPLYLNACDVLAIPYRRSLLVDTSSSCKIAEYFNCRRPIVSTRTPNLTENFPSQAFALGSALCEPGDVADIARAIEFQLDTELVLPPIPGSDWPSLARLARDVIGNTLPPAERR